jgi:hypothetical protein
MSFGIKWITVEGCGRHLEGDIRGIGGILFYINGGGNVFDNVV